MPSNRTHPVHAGVASIPQRAASLRAVVDALSPQVDVLHVYLNGYESMPTFLRGRPGHIRVVRSQDVAPTHDARDNGKFFFLSEDVPVEGAYYLSVDDDIAYPPDYVATLVARVEQYQRRAIVGVHGITLADPLVDYFVNRTVHHFAAGLAADRSVNLLGTGTVAFHRSTLDLSYADFGEPGMADLWLGIAAKTQGVPMRCIARAARWLQPLDTHGAVVPPRRKGGARPLDEERGPNLYDEFSKQAAGRDDPQTRIALERGPWGEATIQATNEGLARALVHGFRPTELRSRGMNVSELCRLAGEGQC